MKFQFSEIRSYFGIVALVGLTLFMVFAVVMRYVFNDPLTFDGDVSEYVFLFIIFLGLGFTERQGEHINVSLVTRWLPGKMQSALAKVVWVIEIAWVLIFLVCVSLLVQDFFVSQSRSMSTLTLLYPIAAFMILGVIVLLIELARKKGRLVPGPDPLKTPAQMKVDANG